MNETFLMMNENNYEASFCSSIEGLLQRRIPVVSAIRTATSKTNNGCIAGIILIVKFQSQPVFKLFYQGIFFRHA